MIQWIATANNPSRFAAPNANAKDIAELRRKARQNVRRLAAKHLEVAAEIVATVKPEDLR